jgi:hypothetical protein
MDAEGANTSDVDRHSALHSRPQLTDSMVSVSLSEPDRPVIEDAESPQPTKLMTPVLLDAEQLDSVRNKEDESDKREIKEPQEPTETPAEYPVTSEQHSSLQSVISAARRYSISNRLSRGNSVASERSAQVDWNALDMTEEREKDETSDEVSCHWHFFSV